MLYRRTLLIVIAFLTLGGISRPALAQEVESPSQDRYVEELKQRNADYGPGCNGIGISVPMVVDVPKDMTDRWAGGHSACTPGIRFVMACAGEIAGEERVITCMLRIAESQSDRSIWMGSRTFHCHLFTGCVERDMKTAPSIRPNGLT